MIQKYMDELKKELVFVKNHINDGNVYDFDVFRSNENYFGCAMKYYIIMNNGDNFVIQNGSNIFPDIDFSDISYIQKNHFHNNLYTDTENGVSTDEDSFGRFVWAFNLFDCKGKNEFFTCKED